MIFDLKRIIKLYLAAALSDYSKQSLSLDINSREETNAIKVKLPPKASMISCSHLH
jgi:hypothetical protein